MPHTILTKGFASAPPQVTPTIHHDVYARISPYNGLRESAKGLRVLITGSGRGIGRSIAIGFAVAGASKVIITSRNQQQLDDVKRDIHSALPRDTKIDVIAISGDISSADFVEKLFKEAGTLDVLINNAGVLGSSIKPIHETEPEEWWKIQEINAKGTYLTTREFLRTNLGHKLTIINTSSISSFSANTGFSSYETSKTFVNRFTEFVHAEYSDDNVRAFAYHPGTVFTDMSLVLPEAIHSYLNDKPELAAGFTLWLATQHDETDFLRGRYLSISWDVDELLAKKEEIVKDNLFWTRVVGQ